MKVLVTGVAGFIGYHVAKALLTRGDAVIGLDSVNAYYDPALKEARLGDLERAAKELAANFTFIRANIADASAVKECFARCAFDRVIHLAAQAGIRHSIDNPHDYVEANLVGFTNILEACRHNRIPHLTYASTSSVYGASTRMPYTEHDAADHPLQFYAATKRANELMAHAYSQLFGLPTTALRFFTVYGPWGRPDMALFTFTKAILEGKPVQMFNYGRHTRDFTYIDDAVEAIVRVSDRIAAPNPQWRREAPDPATSSAPFRIYNIGNHSPITVNVYIEALEEALGLPAERELMPMQPGDAPDTFADVSELMGAVDFRPQTPVKVGVARFVEWYRSYYRH
jgi:UDP-glucuronate 4-epimerase